MHTHIRTGIVQQRRKSKGGRCRVMSVVRLRPQPRFKRDSNPYDELDRLWGATGESPTSKNRAHVLGRMQYAPAAGKQVLAVHNGCDR